MKLSTAVLFISAVSAANAANTNIRGATDDDRKLQPVDPTAAVDPAANTNIRGNSIEEIIDGKMDKSRGITWNSIGRVTRWLADVITDDSSVVIPTNSTTDGTDVKPTDGGDVTPVIPSDGGDVTPVKPADGGDVTPVKPDDGGDVTPVKPDDGGDVTPVKPDDGGDVPAEPEADTWGPTQEDTSGDTAAYVYKKYEEVHDGKHYIVDESPDCVPGQMKINYASSLTKEMHKQIVKEKREMAKLKTAKERDTKAKEHKGKFSTLTLSLGLDATAARKASAEAGATIYATHNENSAAHVLCKIAKKDFGEGTSELTMLVMNNALLDYQKMAATAVEDQVSADLFDAPAEAVEAEKVAIAKVASKVDALERTDLVLEVATQQDAKAEQEVVAAAAEAQDTSAKELLG